MSELTPRRVLGRDLKVGDIIAVWWRPHRDVITRLQPYRSPLASLFPMGAKLADFALNKSGMTIDNAEYYTVYNRPSENEA